MSDFTVLRSLDGYCLVLDKKRIAGGKPDYRGENVLVDWTTEVAYGPVDDLAAENAKLREQGERLFDKTLELGTENAKLREQIHWLKKGDILHVLTDQEYIDQCERERLMQVSIDALDKENAKLRELVRDMHACISHANEQDWFYFERDKFGCGMSCTVNGEACGLCALADRMRELGVDA